MMNPETPMTPTTTTTESLVTPDEIGTVGLANAVSEEVLAFEHAKRQMAAEAAIKPNRKQRRATEARMRRAVRKMRKEIGANP